MNQHLTPAQQLQRALEERYPPGYYVEHKATHRRYFIIDTDEHGCEMIQAVRGPESNMHNAPRLTLAWHRMERSFFYARRD